MTQKSLETLLEAVGADLKGGERQRARGSSAVEAAQQPG